MKTLRRTLSVPFFMKYLNLSTFDFGLNIVNLYYVYHDSLKLHVQHGYLEEDRYPIREVSHPTNIHECLTDDDSNKMPL